MPYRHRIGIVSFRLIVLALPLIVARTSRVQAGFAVAAPGTVAASAPYGLQLALAEFATGLSQPLSITNAGDDRLFVVEKAGRIRIVRPDGTVESTPYLDIASRVDDSGGEMGLLGLAFHPDYASNGYFYVNYTTTAEGPRRTRISRFSVSADPDVADPASEDVLLTVDQPAANHNAGDIHFGPDGYLYIPLGDGGDSSTAQNMGLLLGKVSRIDVDSASGSAAECYGTGTGDYTVPGSNPFVDGAGGSCDEIWAVGFRNPWRSSFDRTTGDLYLGDVGQSQWEEIDVQPAGSPGGQNYGWPCYEGDHAYNTTGCAPISSYTFPVFEYSHSDGCAVIGGYVYRGTDYPPMVGRYLLADHCSGSFWDLVHAGGEWQATLHPDLGGSGTAAFGEDVNGELYMANLGQGVLYRVQGRAAIYLPAVLKQY
jgi:glucose/arabinose dehydrogenase